ncbi:MAG TPA: potassium channel family protein [Nocardioides sp.]|uniref:potassium channel family protein n=1 Tax=uncultured Nocardioides sp. TaxID=198441 RepID=UPI000EB84251|nr:potassium channel family protein [uncultured Nocardioides sp.]HCB04377.1 two pore domain potassium channel family protein [Nocardioides sp.]HRD63662.1 potassium channel family protein [Nocardioides sp.]HRI96629.1 potassium channel family protein [Nocardioides sp.]HRK47322.1 potassium channel family protein [Nocardioides sp.]
MAHFRFIERRFEKFLRTQLSVRKAMGVIVYATVASVLIGGVVITLVDPHDFEGVGDGLWWALQTVTTVGYGDVVPTTPVGRVIGSVIMLESIAFISIVTAAITSTFVERARHQNAAALEALGSGPVQHDQLMAQLAEVTARLDLIQRALGIETPSAGEGDLQA